MTLISYVCVPTPSGSIKVPISELINGHFMKSEQFVVVNMQGIKINSK